MKRVGFSQAYSFKYSKRPGTPAAVADRQVPEAEMRERLTQLQHAILEGQTLFNLASVGQIVPVLFDRTGTRPGQLHGRSPHMQSVHVYAPSTLLGQIAPVVINAGRALSLTGSLADDDRGMVA